MADQIVQRVAVKAMITNSTGKVLIVREAQSYDEGTIKGRYHLPGGRLNPGEAYQDGLRREVSEETGLKVGIGKPLHIGEWRPVIKGVPHQIIAIYIACRAVDSTVRLSEEHDGYEWITPSDADKFDIVMPDLGIIKESTKSLS